MNIDKSSNNILMQIWVFYRVYESFRLCNNIYKMYNDSNLMNVKIFVDYLYDNNKNNFQFNINHDDLLRIKKALDYIYNREECWKELTCYERIVSNAKKLLDIF